MFVLAKLDVYGYGGGAERLESVYGPFATRKEAEALEARIDKLGLVGTEYRIKEIEPVDRAVEFLNGLGMGAV